MIFVLYSGEATIKKIGQHDLAAYWDHVLVAKRRKWSVSCPVETHDYLHNYCGSFRAFLP